MQNPEELEEKIKEQRSVEANKKGLVGQTGKIGIVLKVFGEPIVAQIEGGGYVDTNYLNAWHDEFEEDPKNNIDLMKKIPVMGFEENERPQSEEWTAMSDPIYFGTQQIGWYFDGLSRSMHLEIKYDELNAELILTYKGYVAYKEVKGEILSYVPNKEWENWIDSLYKKAKEKLRKTKEIEFENKIKEAEKRKSSWWDQMISRWGVK
jgi:hypothetical protein